MPTHTTPAPSLGMPHAVPTLPTTHAFVVQFRTETELERGRMAGRVEHVRSGQAQHFCSLEDLAAFFARVLAEVRAPPRRRRRKKK